jgi:hypothetical protein
MTFAAPVAILLMCLSAVAAQPVEARGLHDGPSRVRASDSRTAAILLDGLNRSETVRDLVNEIEQSDVIVYLEIQWNLRRGLVGSLTWVTDTGASRYVRISLNPDLTGDATVATLAHELQHAVEIAREPSIISSATMASYYARHGLSMSQHWNGWDTEAARRTGDVVRRELATGQHKFHGPATFSQHRDVTVGS